MKDLFTDYHIHTCLRPVDDGAETMTPAAVATHFKAKGHSCFGLSPHLHYDADIAALVDFLDTARTEAAACGMKMLRGVETECTDENGTLTLKPELIPHLDYVIASADHFNCTGVVRPPKTAQELIDLHLRLLMKLAENPIVDIIAHPFAALILLTSEGHLPGNEVIDTLDWLDDSWTRQFAKTARQNHTTVELNGFFTLTYPEKLRREGRPLYTDTYRKFYRQLAQEGVTLLPSSDAHSLDSLAQFDHAAQCLAKM